jgi:hypothetical protein
LFGAKRGWQLLLANEMIDTGLVSWRRTTPAITPAVATITEVVEGKLISKEDF